MERASDNRAHKKSRSAGQTASALDSSGFAAASPVLKPHVFAPYGKAAEELLLEIKHLMIDVGLSPHGATKIFREQLKQRKMNGQVTDPEPLKLQFLEEAIAENKRSQSEKKAIRERENAGLTVSKAAKKNSRGWTRELKLNRPAWPPEHRNMTEVGEDIRHIIRNAKLRDALLQVYDYLKKNQPGNLLNILGKLAQNLEVEARARDHPWQIMARIYKKLYLHSGNLFGDASGVNRAIGLAADDIENTGKQLVQGGDKLVTLDEVDNYLEYLMDKARKRYDANCDAADDLWQKVFQKTRDTKQADLAYETYLDGLDDWLDVNESYITDRCSVLADEAGQGKLTYHNLGQFLIGIGSNYGFDLITKDASNAQSIQERQAALARVELALSEFDPSQGLDRFTAIFVSFLNAGTDPSKRLAWTEGIPLY